VSTFGVVIYGQRGCGMFWFHLKTVSIAKLSVVLVRSIPNGSAGPAKDPLVVKALADRFSRFGPQRTVQSYSDTFYTTVQQGLVDQYNTFPTRFQSAVNQLALLKFDTELANVSPMLIGVPSLHLYLTCVTHQMIAPPPDCRQQQPQK